MDNALNLLLGTYPSWSRALVRLALRVVFIARGGQKVLGWFGALSSAGLLRSWGTD